VTRLFAFGTLKKGFPLQTYLGSFRTKQRLPMLIAGSRYAPIMFHEPGTSCHDRGGGMPSRRISSSRPTS
jgi:gamma-glutamylaminecyclotransferase